MFKILYKYIYIYMSLIYNIPNDDIDLFVNSYNSNLLNGTVNNPKLPSYVELLKTIKYYRNNGVEFDEQFLKRFNFNEEDVGKLSKLLNRIKKGKPLHHREINYRVNGCSGTSNQIYSGFNENENYSGTPKFELFSQVEGAMNEYYTKMNKMKEKRNLEKQKSQERSFDINQGSCINANRYYTESEVAQRPQFDVDHTAFARTKLFDTDRSESIRQFDIINNVLDNEQLITQNFDTEFKLAYPNIQNIKRVNHYNNINHGYGESICSDRYFQDLSLMNTSNTRNRAIKNNQPFENQFQYLDCNYNQVLDDRLIGTSSRLDNRSMSFKR